MKTTEPTPKVIYSAPGLVLAISGVAATMTHYGPARGQQARPGYHGWLDTRDRPDLADAFPETMRSPDLAAVVRAANGVGSPLVSIACDVDEYQVGGKSRVGGYVCVSYRDLEHAADTETIISLARWIIGGLDRAHGGNERFGFEFTVEPLKRYYGRSDCHCVELKAVGEGDDAPQAWHAFGVAARQIAASLERATPEVA